jgi:hypothetical protein
MEQLFPSSLVPMLAITPFFVNPSAEFNQACFNLLHIEENSGRLRAINKRG